MDQFSTEKLWHSSNVMGFDVDAELHYRTPMKPVKPLFICLLPMQRTLAGNMPHFSYAWVFFVFFSISCKEECGSCHAWHTHPPTLLLHVIGSSLPAKNLTFDPFVALIRSFVGFVKWKSCGLQRFLIVNKVWFHLCQGGIHLQLQIAPWWNIWSWSKLFD